ncbi:MAG TPA: hypothetical protein VJ783_01005 [Pirellulales bacterium]|nr:hypothetical protein [Pirellulales bacterium]
MIRPTLIRRLLAWIRVAAPPPWTPLLLLPVVAYEAVYGWIWWRAGPMPELLKPRDGFWMFAAFVLGGYRAWAYHPLFHTGYRNWLRLTPWTSRLPLVVGPLQLLPQDLVWLGVGLLAWHDPQISRLNLPLYFLFAYLMVICVSCWATGLPFMGYLLAFGLGEFFRQWPNPASAAIVACWLYLAAWLAVRGMLARFPWHVSWVWEQPSLQAINEGVRQRLLGWPLDQLHGRETDPRVSHIDGLMVALLAGWWSFCAFSLAGNPLRAHWSWMALWLVAFSGISQRFFGYWIDYRPPISLWGRLWTGRWIIPRYDHFLVTPVFIYLTAYYMPRVLKAWQVPADAVLPIATSLVALVALNMPPSFVRWRLTGFHRIVPGSMNKQEFMKQ